MDFEHQKKINLDSLEQKQTMEKNNFTMAREIDKLRAELMNMERKLHNAYPGAFLIKRFPDTRLSDNIINCLTHLRILSFSSTK